MAVTPEIAADVETGHGEAGHGSVSDHRPFADTPPPKRNARNGGALELGRALDDAECLLHYASQAGIEIPTDVMTDVLTTRDAREQNKLDTKIITGFLAANTKLSAKLAPVTAETVRASNERFGTEVKGRETLALITTVFTVALSVLLFVTTSISDDINEGITKTNVMAATARLHVGAPAIGNVADEKCGLAVAAPSPPIVMSPPMTEQSMIVELQSFAAAIRDLHNRALKLNRFVASSEADPITTSSAVGQPKAPWDNAYDALQLPPSLSNFRAAALCKIAVYQQVRNFAQNVSADSALIYGSLSKYLLPVLFALLGSLAYNLRDYTNRVKTRTFHPSNLDSARIIVALIAGAIFSYFNSFTQGLNLLAAAFLVGYGVEIFFAFLDSLLVSFGAKKPAPAPDAVGRPR